MNLINRKEMWTALAAFIIYLAAVKIASIETTSMDVGIAIAGIAEFLRASSLFLGGYTLAVFATPRIRAHELNEPLLVILTYMYRLSVGISFLAFAFS